MKNHRLKLTLLALIGAALLVQSAKAQSISIASGDLLLGVEASSGTGSAYDYEVNLGSISTFTGEAPGGILNLSSIVSDADITGTGASGGFGTNANVVFSVVGVTSGLATEQTTGGVAYFTATASPTALDGEQLLGTVQDIDTAYGSLNNVTSTANSAEAAFIAAANGNSYTSEENATSNDFFALSLTGTASVSGGTLALYANTANTNRNDTSNPGSIAEIGTFSFVNGNTFEFQAVQAPEPSTDALMALGGVLLLVVLIKRRNPAPRL